MGLAPAPQTPERIGAVYERKLSSAQPGLRGPLRFEEGIATDTDVPNEFMLGMQQGYRPAPGRPNHNAPVYIKTPQETMAERAHVGSAAWVESPQYLGEFAHGTFTDYAEVSYEQVVRPGTRLQHVNPALVVD